MNPRSTRRVNRSLCLGSAESCLDSRKGAKHQSNDAMQLPLALSLAASVLCGATAHTIFVQLEAGGTTYGKATRVPRKVCLPVD